MSDIALKWNDKLHAADFAIAKNDLVLDGGLQTAVLLSLFVDRRAEPGDVLPEGETDRRGFWGDVVPVVEGDRTGSWLWLLARSKETPDVVRRAEEYAREALQWLLDDKVADRFDVAVTIPRVGMMGTVITIYRPARDSVEFRFNRTWLAQAGEV